jgi:hypothetical protein
MADEKPVESQEELNTYDQIRKDLKNDLTAELKGEITDSVVSEVKKEFSRKEKNFAVAKEEKGLSFGEWLQNYTILKHPKFSMDQKTKAHNMLSEKTMTQGSAAGGGNFVPTIYSSSLLPLKGLTACFPSGCQHFQHGFQC